MSLDLTPEQIEGLRERILDFDGWAECRCRECRQDIGSHAINHERSLELLAEYVLEED